MPLPYPKQAFKKRGKYLGPRNPSGKNFPSFVKLKLTTYKQPTRFFEGG